MRPNVILGVASLAGAANASSFETLVTRVQPSSSEPSVSAAPSSTTTSFSYPQPGYPGGYGPRTTANDATPTTSSGVTVKCPPLLSPTTTFAPLPLADLDIDIADPSIIKRQRMGPRPFPWLPDGWFAGFGRNRRPEPPKTKIPMVFLPQNDDVEYSLEVELPRADGKDDARDGGVKKGTQVEIPVFFYPDDPGEEWPTPEELGWKSSPAIYPVVPELTTNSRVRVFTVTETSVVPTVSLVGGGDEEKETVTSTVEAKTTTAPQIVTVTAASPAHEVTTTATGPTIVTVTATPAEEEEAPATVTVTASPAANEEEKVDEEKAGEKKVEKRRLLPEWLGFNGKDVPPQPEQPTALVPIDTRTRKIVQSEPLVLKEGSDGGSIELVLVGKRDVVDDDSNNNNKGEPNDEKANPSLPLDPSVLAGLGDPMVLPHGLGPKRRFARDMSDLPPQPEPTTQTKPTKTVKLMAVPHPSVDLFFHPIPIPDLPEQEEKSVEMGDFDWTETMEFAYEEDDDEYEDDECLSVRIPERDADEQDLEARGESEDKTSSSSSSSSTTSVEWDVPTSRWGSAGTATNTGGSTSYYEWETATSTTTSTTTTSSASSASASASDDATATATSDDKSTLSTVTRTSSSSSSEATATATATAGGPLSGDGSDSGSGSDGQGQQESSGVREGSAGRGMATAAMVVVFWFAVRLL